jgi:quercetin dioxygenase-like cupin family protein
VLPPIINGGQTGADRAGLDFAIEAGLDHGGFVPKGRKSCVRVRPEGLMPQRRRLITGVALCASVIGAAGVDTTVLARADWNSAALTEPRIVAESRFVVTNARAQSDLVQLVVDFESSAWTSLHTHGGQAINLVLEGEITLRHGGTNRPYKAGQSWTDSAGQVHAAGNTGSGKARLLTNFLLPNGAPEITVLRESQFGPVVTYQAKFPLPSLATETEIVQQVIDLPPGWRAKRAYHGFVAGLVMEGEVTLRIDSDRKLYKPGDAWMAQAGTVVTEENNGPKRARVFVSYLVRKGATP